MQEWAWADVVAADLMLDEVERVDALRDRSRAMDLASLIALAFHEPKRLELAEADLQRDMQMQDPKQKDAAVQRIEDVVSLMDRIERRKRNAQHGTGSP